MKHIATFAIVSFMALFSQSNARASICNRAYNNLSDRFSDNTNKLLEPDSVVERKVLEEGDTVYRYMPKPVDLGPIINQTPSKSPKKRALRASRPNDFGVPKFDNYAQGNRYVGRIAIQEGVSPSGAKTYSIPITTANCCGTAPQMAITYSSQAANGAAGYGWNVSGASAIMAVGKSIMFDGVTASADLTQPDECRFALDGVRLVDNTGGLSQYQYVTSRGFTLVKKHCYGAHVAYFTVAYPNGSTATFGFKDNTTTRYLYPLTEICYSNGYRMNFTYEESGNCYYLSKVAYGGKTEHDHTGLSVFSYANRTDCTEAFVAGIGIKPNKLLKGVVSQTKVNGKFETLCSYKLTHVERGVNLLTQLDCVSDDAALPPLQFAYGEGEDATQARLVESSQLLLTKYFANDSNTKKPIYLRGKLVKNNYADGLLAMPGHFHQYQKTGERVITKFFVKQRYAIGETMVPSGYVDNGKIWTSLISTGRGFAKRQMPIVNREMWDKYLMMDVDKNGLADLLCTRDGNTRLFLNVNGKLQETACCNFSLSQNTQLLPANVNNPWGMSQLVTISNAVVSCYNFTTDENSNRMLTGMADSYGLVQHNRYEDMTAEWSNYVPSRSTYAYPYFNFMAPLRLLSSSITYSGREMLKHLRYTYSGAVAHRTGFGFVGFENTRVDEGMSGNYTKERHDPEHLGVTTHIETREKDVYMSYANAFLAPNKTCNPLLMSLTEDFKLTGVWKETLFRYDEFNNLTQQRTSFDEDNLYTEEGQSYRNIVTPERYQLGLPLTKTTTSGRNGSTWTTREEITYNAEWRPERQTTYINGNKTGETHWTYDAHGNMASEKSAPYNVTELLGNTYTYDASGRNLLTKTNALGQTTTFADYDKWGQPHRIIDHKGKASTIVTDAWGKPTSTTSPDGVTATTTTAWGGKELYTIAKSVTGQPDVIVHYDALGREVRKGNRRFDGKWQFVDNVYDVKGRLEKTSLPFKGDAPTLWATYEYDEYDRPVKFTEASGKATTWSYAELSVTETKGGIATTKTTDVSGALIKVEDPGGTITYALRPDGQPSAITAPGNVTTTFEYDNFGRRTAIVDPSAGRRTFSESYNADGKRTVVETNADGGSITTLYDKYGRAAETRRPEFNTTYTYTKDGLLASEESSNGTSKEYYYDDYGRLACSRENALDGKYLQKQFQYDKGNVSAVSYRSASGFLCEERYEYANGHNVEIKLQDGRKVWKLTEENDLGQAQKVQSGVVERNYGYSETGLPSICRYNNIIPYSIHYTDFGFNYEFDAQTNNLLSRTNCRYKHAEYFSYDNLNRLTRMSYYAGDSLVAYAANGNIVQKRNVGTMSYANAARPYQLTSVTPSDTSIPLRDQRISYTSFMRPERIEEKGYVAKFDYNAAADRVRMNVTHGAQNVLTRHYIGNQYECDIDSFGEITERLYLGGDAYSAPAVFIRHENEGGNVYQIIRDYLGSVVYVTDDNGYLKQELEYDAWGRLRSPSYIEYYKEGEEPTLLLGRGYCGHEYLPWFGLINMNARLYDPVLGRFLSPDPYVQMPDFTQSFNRYSYCLNNPLKYVDKDGKFAWFIPVLVGAVIGAYSGAVIANDGEYNPAKWDFHSGKTWRYMLGGAVVGGASGYIGGAIAASGIPLANTASIAAASLINSFGTWAYTGGQTPISVSIGFASYNFSDGTFGFLGKKGNLGIQTLGYVLGALNNLADIGKTGYLLLNTEKKDLINHSAIREMDGKTIISIGPGKEWIVPKGSVDHYLNRFLGANGATNRYPVKGVDTIIRHVNTSTIKTYGRMLDVLTKEGRGILPYSFLYSSCSTHTGLALNLAGIPTLFIHPYTVLGSIWLWNIGITPALINNSFHFQTR